MVHCMKITLLTHFKEFEKRSNTGRLVVDVLGGVAEQVRWDRMTPSPRLIKEIEAGGWHWSTLAPQTTVTTI